jgi:hypothetical protein
VWPCFSRQILAGRDPRTAVRAVVDPLQRALSCVTDGVINYRGGDYPGKIHPLTVGDGDRFRLKGQLDIWLSVAQHYEVVQAPPPRGPWKVATRAYWYRVDYLDKSEMLSYHWHPLSRSPVTSPHLHLAAYPRTHFPTGRACLEEVLRFAILDLDVEPLRDDWSTVLEGSQRVYERWRTWPGSEPLEGSESAT